MLIKITIRFNPYKKHHQPPKQPSGEYYTPQKNLILILSESVGDLNNNSKILFESKI